MFYVFYISNKKLSCPKSLQTFKIWTSVFSSKKLACQLSASISSVNYMLAYQRHGVEYLPIMPAIDPSRKIGAHNSA